METPTNFMAFNVKSKKNIYGVYYENSRKFLLAFVLNA
jgi:hypothetical protein